MEEKEMEEMFCFQCQQTAHNTGCEGHTGVCGKKSDTANLQDELTGELIRWQGQLQKMKEADLRMN